MAAPAANLEPATAPASEVELIIRSVTSALLAPDFRLPNLPQAISQVMALASKPDVTFAEVDKIVRHSPALTARVLAVANSPMYRTRSPITSLRTAMMMLGWTTLRDVLWQAVAEAHVFKGQARRKMAELRDHAVNVAHGARVVCRTLGIDGEFAFVCGLLHDLGEPLCLQMVEAHDVPLDRQAGLVDTIHTTVGERIAEAWGLPPVIVAVCRHHHDFERWGSQAPPAALGMPAAVLAAECLVESIMVAPDEPLPDPLPAVFDSLQLQASDVAMLLEETKTTLSRVH